MKTETPATKLTPVQFATLEAINTAIATVKAEVEKSIAEANMTATDGTPARASSWVPLDILATRFKINRGTIRQIAGKGKLEQKMSDGLGALVKIPDAAKTVTITALEVVEGDIVISMGYRCRASNVRHIAEDAFVVDAHAKRNGPVARYTLTSEPSDQRPDRLPPGYEGYTSGGNKLFTVCVERA